VSPAGWLLIFLLGGALALIPAVMRPGAGKVGLAMGVALLLLDLLVVAGTVRLFRAR
jgi:hypothetical protein